MDGVAAEHPGSLQLEQGQGPEPGKREGRSSETAAVGAAEDRAGGLQAEYCILWGERWREEGRIAWFFFSPKRNEQHFSTELISFYPTQF